MRYLLVLMIFALSVATACQQAATQVTNNPAKSTAASQDDAKRISLGEAKQAYDAGTAAIIDTRALTAYQSEHIKGAISMPVDEVEKRYGELPKDKQLIFYCS